MGNPFVHVELMSTDLDKAKSFYARMFQWELEDMPGGEGDYTLIKVGDGTGGGMMRNPIPNAPSMWMPYVLVENLQEATRKAQSLGAKLMKDVTEVPEMGAFTIITDPAGGMLGLWETAMGGGQQQRY
jgi:predicted enzyme related to lactoylglutathione lyase